MEDETSSPHKLYIPAAQKYILTYLLLYFLSLQNLCE